MASSFSSCPDEEGTESLTKLNKSILNLCVSAVVPMRRELKAIVESPASVVSGVGFSSCPDEEGTERL